jgi:serine/threonine-protein kinase
MVAHQLLTRPSPPSRFNSDIDAQLELVIMTAINKRPDQRYPSMQLVNRDLKQLARSEPGEAALWARERSTDPYPLDSPNAKFAASAFREFMT